MEDRLLPTNGLLGLVTSHDVNEPLLRNAGFKLAGLEVPVAVGSGKVVVDVVLFNERESQFLACEAKSGANVERAQAEKYRALEANALVHASQVTLSNRVQPSVTVLYACQCEHVDRIRRGLSDAQLNCAVVGTCRNHLTFDVPADTPALLRETLPHPILALKGPPPRLIEFDHESPVSIIQPAVHAQLVRALAMRKTQVSARWLAEETAPHLPFYGRTARHQLIRKISEAARKVTEADRATFEYHGPRSNDENFGMVYLLKTPEDNDPRGRTQAYQALARGNQVRRRKTQQHDPDQLDLLQPLVQADDEDVTDDAEGTS